MNKLREITIYRAVFVPDGNGGMKKVTKAFVAKVNNEIPSTHRICNERV